MGSEWQYKGEGNANIVFSYTGIDPALQGCVLRIRKQYKHPAQHDESFIALEEQLWSCTMSWSSNPLEREAAYKATHIAPVLGWDCVHIGTPVGLPDDVGAYLKNEREIEFTLPAILLPDHTVFKTSSLEECSRSACGLPSAPAPSLLPQLQSTSSSFSPPSTSHHSPHQPLSSQAVPTQAPLHAALRSLDPLSRLTGPSVLTQSPLNATHHSLDPLSYSTGQSALAQAPLNAAHHSLDPLSHSTGQSAPAQAPLNAAHHSLDPPTPTLGPSVCVEIKPKCGFLPTTTTISPDRTLKHYFPRYFMHQLFKFTKGKVKAISGYNPLDLFSKDPDRMASAIRALLDCPQNNLRVFEDGGTLFGGKDSCSSDELEARLQRLWLSERRASERVRQDGGRGRHESDAAGVTQLHVEWGTESCVEYCEHGLEEVLALDCDNIVEHHEKGLTTNAHARLDPACSSAHNIVIGQQSCDVTEPGRIVHACHKARGSANDATVNDSGAWTEPHCTVNDVDSCRLTGPGSTVHACGETSVSEQGMDFCGPTTCQSNVHAPDGETQGIKATVGPCGVSPIASVGLSPTLSTQLSISSPSEHASGAVLPSMHHRASYGPQASMPGSQQGVPLSSSTFWSIAAPRMKLGKKRRSCMSYLLAWLSGRLGRGYQQLVGSRFRIRKLKLNYAAQHALCTQHNCASLWNTDTARNTGTGFESGQSFRIETFRDSNSSTYSNLAAHELNSVCSSINSGSSIEGGTCNYSCDDEACDEPGRNTVHYTVHGCESCDDASHQLSSWSSGQERLLGAVGDERVVEGGERGVVGVDGQVRSQEGASYTAGLHSFPPATCAVGGQRVNTDLQRRPLEEDSFTPGPSSFSLAASSYGTESGTDVQAASQEEGGSFNPGPCSFSSTTSACGTERVTTGAQAASQREEGSFALGPCSFSSTTSAHGTERVATGAQAASQQEDSSFTPGPRRFSPSSSVTKPAPRSPLSRLASNTAAPPVRVVQRQQTFPAASGQSHGATEAVQSHGPAQAVQSCAPGKAVQYHNSAQTVQCCRPGQAVQSHSPGQAVPSHKSGQAVQSHSPGQALLTRLVCQALQQTGVIDRLLVLQKMDVWDVEGIAIILERLLQADPADVAAAAAESASLSLPTDSSTSFEVITPEHCLSSTSDLSSVTVVAPDTDESAPLSRFSSFGTPSEAHPEHCLSSTSSLPAVAAVAPAAAESASLSRPSSCSTADVVTNSGHCLFPTSSLSSTDASAHSQSHSFLSGSCTSACMSPSHHVSTAIVCPEVPNGCEQHEQNGESAKSDALSANVFHVSEDVDGMFGSVKAYRKGACDGLDSRQREQDESDKGFSITARVAASDEEVGAIFEHESSRKACRDVSSTACAVACLDEDVGAIFEHENSRKACGDVSDTAHAVASLDADVAAIYECVQSHKNSASIPASGPANEEVAAIFEHAQCRNKHTSTSVTAHAVTLADEEGTAIFNRPVLPCTRGDPIQDSSNDFSITAHAVNSTEYVDSFISNNHSRAAAGKSNHAVNQEGVDSIFSFKHSQTAAYQFAPASEEEVDCIFNNKHPRPVPEDQGDSRVDDDQSCTELLSEESGDIDTNTVPGSRNSLSPRCKVLCLEDVLFYPSHYPASMHCPTHASSSHPTVTRMPQAHDSELTARLSHIAVSGQADGQVRSSTAVPSDGQFRSSTCGQSDGQFGSSTTGHSDGDEGGCRQEEDDSERTSTDSSSFGVRQGSSVYDLPCPPQPVKTPAMHPEQIMAESSRQSEQPIRRLESFQPPGRMSPSPRAERKKLTLNIKPHASPFEQGAKEVCNNSGMHEKRSSSLDGKPWLLPQISVPCSARAVMTGSPRYLTQSPRSPLARLSSSCPSSPSASLERVSRALLRKPSLVTQATAPVHAKTLAAAIAAVPAAGQLLAAGAAQLRCTAGAAALRQQQHAAALGQLEALPLAQCLAALRGYLIAATAKDCGVMVTVQQVRETEVNPAHLCKQQVSPGAGAGMHQPQPQHSAQVSKVQSMHAGPSQAATHADRLAAEPCGVVSESGRRMDVPEPGAGASTSGAGGDVDGLSRHLRVALPDGCGSEMMCVVQDACTGLSFLCKVAFVDLDLKPLSKVLQHLDLDERIVEHMQQMMPYLLAVG